MKILYGVQATGQGHISRARAMSRALRCHDVDVTWLFSGRRREALFDMDCFGSYEHRRGLWRQTVSGSDAADDANPLDHCSHKRDRTAA